MALYADSRIFAASVVQDPAMRANAMACVLIVHRDGLQQRGDGLWLLRSLPLQQALGVNIRNWLQFDERDTPSAARAPCFSGVLLPGGRVLTALHGRRAASREALLRDLRFLIGYQRPPGDRNPATFMAGRTLLQADAVQCADAGQAPQDWALFTLSAEPGALPSPAELCVADPAPGTPLYLAGFPYGMPLRISTGGCWLEADEPGAFRTRLNAFRCHSGAPVFDAGSHRVAGWLVAGERDLVRCPDGSGDFEWSVADPAEALAAELCHSVRLLP